MLPRILQYATHPCNPDDNSTGELEGTEVNKLYFKENSFFSFFLFPPPSPFIQIYTCVCAHACVCMRVDTCVLKPRLN